MRRFFGSTARSRQKPDTLLLADALGLISPQKAVPNASNYKPLLLRSLQNEKLPEPKIHIPTKDHTQLLQTLLMDLQKATQPRVKRDLTFVKRENTEEEILDLINLLFAQRKLTLALFTKLLLHRNLTLLGRLPFSLDACKDDLIKNGWTETNLVELQVVLLKKYHDLKKPLLIVRSLKENFSTFQAMIEAGQLSPFYERIVWKFYFDYAATPHDEVYWIRKLDSVRSSFMIWESSSKNGKIASAALKQHKLSPLQSVFLRLCCSNPAQRLIQSEFESGASPFLSLLKKISVKNKLYKLDEDPTKVGSRALVYLVIHSMESAIANLALDAELEQLLGELAAYRASLMKQEGETLEFDAVTT